MPYSKTTWVEGTTPITAVRLNNIEDGIAAIWTPFFDNQIHPRYHVETSDGGAIMWRASDTIYGTSTANANFIVGIQDTAHAHRYLVGVVHFQRESYLQWTTIAGAELSCVTNTLGTISVMGLAGQSRFTVIGIGGLN